MEIDIYTEAFVDTTNQTEIDRWMNQDAGPDPENTMWDKLDPNDEVAGIQTNCLSKSRGKREREGIYRRRLPYWRAVPEEICSC